MSEDRPPRSESTSRLNRLLDGLNDEFDEWRSLGWSVDGLIEMLAQDPVKLGLDLPGIRGAMASHELRVSRFSRLPWALDTGLAERVLSELRRPECLIGLDNEFQELVHTLANAEGDGDSNFQFTPFVPSNPVSTRNRCRYWYRLLKKWSTKSKKSKSSLKKRLRKTSAPPWNSKILKSSIQMKEAFRRKRRYLKRC